MDFANLIVNVLIVICTGLSLFLTIKQGKPKISVIYNYTEIERKKFFSICVFNNDVSRIFSIKEIGYPNQILKRWSKLSFSKLQCKKKDCSKIENGKYKLIECYLNEKFEYGQELYIIFNEQQVKDLIDANSKKHTKIAIIFIGEYKLWVKIPKKYLNQFVE